MEYFDSFIESPKISVIVPAFNAAGTICACVDSILSQKFADFELIIIDDGSTDGTLELCERYSYEDSRIMVFSQLNQGVSAARNNALSRATGEWVAFCDADDTADPDWLDRLVEHTDTADLLISGYKTVFASKTGKKKVRYAGIIEDDVFSDKTRIISDLVKKKLFSNVWNKLFKMDIINRYGIRFDPLLKVFEDELFVLTYLKYADLTVVTSDYSYCYNLPENYQKKYRDVSLSQFNKIIERIYEIVGEDSKKRIHLPEVIYWYSVALQHFVRHHTYEQSVEYIHYFRALSRKFKGNLLATMYLNAIPSNIVYKQLLKNTLV